MSHDSRISINLLPIKADDFSFSIYRQEFDNLNDSSEEDIYQYNLPKSQSEKSEYKSYLVSFTTRVGFSIYECDSHDNPYLTRRFLYHLLLQNLKRDKGSIKYELSNNFHSLRVFFNLKYFPEGIQQVWLEPYYLKSRNKFGFLIDFQFKLDDLQEFNRRVQILSLSLGANGLENKSFYADKFQIINQFIKIHFSNIFPLLNDNSKLIINKTLFKLPVDHLENKTYVFGKDKKADSQYIGTRRYSPLTPIRNSPNIFFVYRQKDRLLSLDLYKALRGESFPNRFSGMKKMFGFTLDPSNVSGIAVDNFSTEEVSRVRDKILNSEKSDPRLAIIIAPWEEDSEEDKNTYYRTKHTFISARIPTQVVRTHTLERDSRLEWSVANIALQAFAKLGGQPWKIAPKHKDCLIIGVGQAHQKEHSDKGQVRIKKYYAYSVLTDSSGLFKKIRPLAKSHDRDTYLQELKESIKTTLDEYKTSFSKYVIHTPYRISKDELDTITDVLDKYTSASNLELQFVVLRINQKSKYFGYDHNHNSLVPFESSFVKISKNDFLIWFEGLQYNNRKVRRRYALPLLVNFHYSNTQYLNFYDKKSYLQDALNLSGANWRGFNAKNLPISIYYAQLIAKFIGNFDSLELDEIPLSNLTPWFL